MAEIRIESITKRFADKTAEGGQKVAVDNVSLTVADEEFLVLLGPSGCGKTTLLRAIAGLGTADEGRILIDGRDVTHLPAGERNLSMVFQSYAIFPHMTVADNIGFGLKMRGDDKATIASRVDEAAGLLHIGDLLQRRPSDMSGGQRQRVAVARALAMQAEVVLMDEPLSNLDALLRLEMRAELKRLLSDVGATTIYVTHDQVEALSMGDRIAVMNEGAIQQLDQPASVYDRPATRFVGSFIGNPPMNFLHGTVSGGTASIAGWETTAPSPIADGPITVGVRAENIDVVAPATTDAVHGTVIVVEPLGAQTLLTVEAAGERVKVAVHPTASPASNASPGDTLALRFPAQHLRWVDPETDRVIDDA